MRCSSPGCSRHCADITSRHRGEQERMGDFITTFKKMKGYYLDGDQLFSPQPKPDREPAGLSCRQDLGEPLEIHLEEVSIQAVLQFKVLNYVATIYSFPLANWKKYISWQLSIQLGSTPNDFFGQVFPRNDSSQLLPARLFGSSQRHSEKLEMGRLSHGWVNLKQLTQTQPEG